MAQGSYLVTLCKEGYAEARLALFSNRPGSRRYRVRLRRPDELGEGFVLVPGGRFLQGGDPRVPRSWPRRAVYVPDFAIARHPVTVREYMLFIEELAADLGRPAMARAPRTDARGRRLVRWNDAESRAEVVPLPDYGEDFLDWPVFSISYDDAQAYAEWRSRRQGQELRLPTAVEWEKASRGVDGRLFPWGDIFEPTYCNCRTSSEDQVSLQPVGSFPHDCSPYGVHDLAGGVMEWVHDPTQTHPQLRVVRGGAWNRGEVDCCLAAGRLMPLWTTGTAIGMRLVSPLLGANSGGASSVPGGGALL
jgi:serine/threonine-protein kinase